jgi:hypothetical protein
MESKYHTHGVPVDQIEIIIAHNHQGKLKVVQLSMEALHNMVNQDYLRLVK